MGAAVGFALQGISMIAGGMADAQGNNYEAAKAERASEIGKVQADQISAGQDAELNTTIANIRAIKSASGGNPDSPSTLAYIQKQGETSDRLKRIRAGGAIMQANQDSADAMFYREAASTSLLGGVARSLPYFAQAAA